MKIQYEILDDDFSYKIIRRKDGNYNIQIFSDYDIITLKNVPIDFLASCAIKLKKRGL